MLNQYHQIKIHTISNIRNIGGKKYCSKYIYKPMSAYLCRLVNVLHEVARWLQDRKLSEEQAVLLFPMTIWILCASGTDLRNGVHL